MKSLKALLLSHLTVFTAGVIVGKRIDADELAAYRSVYEDSSDKWRRRCFAAGATIAGVVLVTLGIKRMRRLTT